MSPTSKKKKETTQTFLLESKAAHGLQHKLNTKPQSVAANLFLVTHLADHRGSGPQPRSLDALVGTLSSKADEELVAMDGFPGFW